MHVDWRWIKQRPHFLAEQLSRQHSVLVMYPRHPRRAEFPHNRSIARRIPFLREPRWDVGINILLQKMWIAFVAWLYKPDCVWITFPTFYCFLPQSLKRLPIVYDCMDLAQGFADKGQGQVQMIANLENDLVHHAAAVICSSQYLYNSIVRSRNIHDDANVFLVRNGVSGNMLARCGSSVSQGRMRAVGEARGPLNIAYIGTVAKWVDFASLLYCLERVDDLYLHLIGPEETTRAQHGRLVYHGPVEHDVLQEYVSRFDGFILPFALTPLTRGVDPIKLYEYVAFGKEVFSIYYEEIERFGRYVHFYRSPEELAQLLARFRNGLLPRKADPTRARELLRESTWARRAHDVDLILRRAVRSAGRGRRFGRSWAGASMVRR